MAKDKDTLLVTGGLGFIGSNLAKRLCNKFKIVIIDFNKPPKPEKIIEDLRQRGIEIIISDISSQDTWKEIPECEYIFHAAAQVAAEISWEERALDFQTNSYGTFLVAEYARKNNSQVIYCNTIRVYDPDAIEVAMKKYGKVSEECATIEVSTKPQPPYALSKHLGEYILQLYSHMYGLNVISLRMSGIVGTGQVGSKTHGWLSNIMHCAVNKEKFSILGNGNQTRDVMHVDELIDLIEIELQDFQKFSEGGFAIYNIGGGPENELSINQVIEIIQPDFPYTIEVKKAGARIGEPTHYVTDDGKIRGKGWQPNISSYKKIIKELIKWYLEENGYGGRRNC